MTTTNTILLTTIPVLMLILRGFFVIETVKKRAAASRELRMARAPKNSEERAAELGAILRSRLGIDSPGSIPLDSTWSGDLRIPAGTLDDFFQDIADAFLLEDFGSLERTTNYRDLLSHLEIPAELMS